MFFCSFLGLWKLNFLLPRLIHFTDMWFPSLLLNDLVWFPLLMAFYLHFRSLASSYLIKPHPHRIELRSEGSASSAGAQPVTVIPWGGSLSRLCKSPWRKCKLMYYVDCKEQNKCREQPPTCSFVPTGPVSKARSRSNHKWRKRAGEWAATCCLGLVTGWQVHAEYCVTNNESLGAQEHGDSS